MGSKASRTTTLLFGVVGALALVCAALAFWTASLTPLSLLVACIVLLFAMSTVRHASGLPGRPVPSS